MERHNAVQRILTGIVALGLVLGLLPSIHGVHALAQRQVRSTPSRRANLRVQRVAGAAPQVSSGDAYATQGANACSWTMGTAAVEKVVTLSSGGTYELTSFKNKLLSPVREYVQGGVNSEEFRFIWDGSTYTGASGGWSCQTGQAQTITIGGQTALQVDVVLTRSDLHVQVSKHYIVYPSESLIREWTQYTNTDSIAHTLSQPSFLEQHLMASDAAANNLQLDYMLGANASYSNSWTLQTTTATSSYARIFDSYDEFGCTATPCTNNGTFHETSNAYIPWFSLWDTAHNDGVYMGFDYFGHWQAPIGNADGSAVSLSLHIPNYTKALQPSETMTSPMAFVGTYVTDLDDMTNRLLDWQYRYMWDYTRAPYFGSIRMLGYWSQGAQPPFGNGWDPVGTLQKVFDLADHMRTIGADVYHRDYGWWDSLGDWNGPDFKLSHDYLAKSGMGQLIYYSAYDANQSSQIYAAHPDWFQNASPCGYADRLSDLSIPAAAQRMETLLVNNATLWGDYEWRNDSCPVANVDGATQLAEDQAFRSVQQYFLDHAPGSAIQGVDSGGNEIGYEFERMASGFSFTDRDGFYEQYDASRIFPADKMSGIPDQWSPANCVGGSNGHSYNTLLMFNPDFTGDTSDPAELECMRKLVTTYHYLEQEGVVGRWVRQYHPHGTDSDRNWFERLSQDGNHGLIIYKGSGSSTSVTVYPKGLNPTTTYDVRYQIASGSASRTGSDLMQNGIVLPSIAVGELIYLGLPYHPGAGTDTTAPTAPGAVAVSATVNMNYPGVEVSWSAGSDNNWVSYYEVFRNGVSIAKVSKGLYFFDHSPAANPNATYGVRTVDGDGNVSSITTATGAGSAASTIDDAVGSGMTYAGTWSHDTTNYPDAYNTSISWSNTTGSYVEYTFTGNQVTWYTKLGPNCGIASISIDGSQDATIDTFAPDDNNWDIPIYSKSWPTVGTHTILITVTGTKNSQSSNYYVHMDGLQVLTTPPTVVEDSSPSVLYSGSGWQHSSGTYTAASNADISWDGQAGDYAQLTFSGNEVVWVSKLGPNTGEADVYIDGVFDRRVDTYSYRGADVWQAPVYRKTWPTNGTHTIKIVVTGLKNYDSTGTYVHVDSLQIRTASLNTVVDDSALSYTGTWSNVATNGTYVNADAHASNTAGATAKYTFTGTAVQIIGDRDTNHGYADVTLDGTYEGRVDAYFNGTTGGNKVLWEKDGLASTSHTIQITVVGAHDSAAVDSYVTIDAIAYGNGSLPTFVSLANDTAATYSGSWTSGTTNSSYVNSDAHWSNSTGATWSASFTGTALQIVSDRDSNHGYGDVTIDGIYRGRYDAYYNSTQGGKQIVWEITGLSSGSHTVQVTVAGARDPSASDNYVVLDALYYQ